MFERNNKPHMSLEFVNEFGDRTSVEFEASQGQDSEAAWMVQNFRQFMLAVGFHPDTVKDYLSKE